MMLEATSLRHLMGVPERYSSLNKQNMTFRCMLKFLCNTYVILHVMSATIVFS